MVIPSDARNLQLVELQIPRDARDDKPYREASITA